MLTIGGLDQNKALEILGISRQTLFRYRRADDWPGDNAGLDLIQAYVSLKHKTTGRKAKTDRAADVYRGGSAGASPSKGTGAASLADVENATSDAEELAAAFSLDAELKIVLIEKSKALVRKYQQQVIDEHKRELLARLEKALDLIYDAAAEMDLTPAQVETMRAAIRSAQRKAIGGASEYQPTLI